MGTNGWLGGTKTQFMSLLWCSGLPTPMLAMMLRELGCSGQRETSRFQGLSGGIKCVEGFARRFREVTAQLELD